MKTYRTPYIEQISVSPDDIIMTSLGVTDSDRGGDWDVSLKEIGI